MKNIYQKIIVGLLLTTGYDKLQAYSLLFVNETNTPVSIRLEVIFMQKNGKGLETVKMHHVVQPGQQQSFNYIKTKHCQRIQSLNFEFSYSSDPLTVPCFQCNANHNQELNKKILVGKQGHWVEKFSGQENDTIYIQQILSASLVPAKD